MRVSTMMMYNTAIANLAKSAERMEEIQEVITSLKKINRLSDDPIGVSRVVDYQSQLNKLGQYKNNIASGQAWLGLSDSVLLDMQNLVTEAKTIAIAQSTTTASRETRAAAAVQVHNLYEQLVSYANTKLGGSYIFGGSITNRAPFNADGTYNGNSDDILVEIAEGIKAKINVAGSQFLITDLNPALSTALATAGSTSSSGLVARNSNSIAANPAALSTYRVSFMLTNGLRQEITYTTDDSPTRDELGTGIAAAVNSNDTLSQYIRAAYDPGAGIITFLAREAGEAGNAFSIDADHTTAFEGMVNTSFAGGSPEVTSGFVFDPTNADIVFSENGGAAISASIITHGGALTGEVYTGEEVATLIERAMETQSGLGYRYTVSYDAAADRFTIANDAGNGGTLNLRWGAGGTTAEYALGFNSIDSGPLAAGSSDTSDAAVEFNILAGVNDSFRIRVDGTESGVIALPAGAYTAGALALLMESRINADALLSGAGVSVTVDYDTSRAGQFTITSGSTGINSGVSLISDTGGDFLGSVGLDRDFEVAGTSPTLLADLNGGRGVTAGTVTITNRAGNTAAIDLTGAVTIEDVISAINGSGLNLTAAPNADRSGIDIVDNTGFPIQNLVVEDSATARDLGIVGNKPGAIHGTDLNPALSSATRVSALRGNTGLSLDTVQVINGLHHESIDLGRAGSMGDILNAFNTLGVDITASINPASLTSLDVVSNNPDSTALVNEVAEGSSASDLGVQGGANVFKTLSALEEALEKNDSTALLSMLDQFDRILDTLVEKGSEVGVRTNQLEAINNRIKTSETELQKLKSDIEDADMIEYLTKFSLQQTALEAILTAAGQSLQLSLLNFLR